MNCKNITFLYFKFNRNNAVIVGDLRQLPNVVSEEVSKITDEIFKLFKLEKVVMKLENGEVLLKQNQ